MQRERDFQRAVIDLARLCGWRVHHTRPTLTRAGEWRTPIQGDAGFPDLVLCRAGRVIFAELERVGARPIPQQQGWLDALQQCAGVEVYLLDACRLGRDSGDSDAPIGVGLECACRQAVAESPVMGRFCAGVAVYLWTPSSETQSWIPSRKCPPLYTFGNAPRPNARRREGAQAAIHPQVSHFVTL